MRRGIRKGKMSYTCFIAIMFVLAMAARSFTASYESAGFISQLKYIICSLAVAVAWFKYKRIPPPKHLFYKEAKNVILMVFIIFLTSIFFIVCSGKFYSRTILELIYLTLPIVFAYVMINTLDKEQLYSCMVASMLVFFVGYLLSLGMSFGEILNGIRTTSYRTSFSLLESSSFAAPSVGLAMYFLYNRKNRFMTFLSMLFVFMTFKRIAILFVAVVYFLPLFWNVNKEISKKNLRIIALIFVCASLLYFQIMKPQNVLFLRTHYGINLYEITMTRTYRFRLLYESGYVGAGLGSANAFMTTNFGVNLEMDLLRMIFEMGIVGLCALVFGIFSVVRTRYSLLIVGYMMMNLLMSHSLADSFGWIFTYIAVANCQCYESNDLTLKVKIR